jgi:DNA-binding NtrC family response regulator
MDRVLIVDDEKAVLNCFLVILSQTRRYEVEVLSDSTKAFEALASGHFNVVLLDVDMPVVSGLDLLHHLREHHPEVQAVVVTGVEDVALTVEAMRLGAADWLAKPVEAPRLVAAVDRAMERVRRIGYGALAGAGTAA